jgi:hypothetical protein
MKRLREPTPVNSAREGGMKIIIKRARLSWKVGERVVRRDSEEQGTISESSPIKINWDSGATSYYDREKPGNVRLIKRTISNVTLPKF